MLLVHSQASKGKEEKGCYGMTLLGHPCSIKPCESGGFEIHIEREPGGVTVVLGPDGNGMTREECQRLLELMEWYGQRRLAAMKRKAG